MLKLTALACCALAGAAAADTAGPQATPSARSSLTGTWSLVSWKAVQVDGSVVYPLGADAVGRITNDDAGRMAVQGMRQGRPAFASPDPDSGTPAETETAFRGYLAYYGTYEVDEQAGTVTHFVEVASFPNWVGTRQVRYFTFEGDLLTLSTVPLATSPTGAQAPYHIIVWKRQR